MLIIFDIMGDEDTVVVSQDDDENDNKKQNDNIREELYPEPQLQIVEIENN